MEIASLEDDQLLLPPSDKGVRVLVSISHWYNCNFIHVAQHRPSLEENGPKFAPAYALGSLSAGLPSDPEEPLVNFLYGKESLDGQTLARRLTTITKTPLLFAYDVEDDAHWPDEKAQFIQDVIEFLAPRLVGNATEEQ